MKKAFIFDLDGVIVDTAKYHYLAWKELAAELGFDFPIEHNERQKGVSRMASLEVVLEVGGITGLTPEEKTALADKKNSIYLDMISGLSEKHILPGISEFLQKIRAEGFLVGLGSASKSGRLIIERLGLLPLFDVIVDGHQAWKPKPDPQVFLLAGEQMAVPADRCIVVEDAAAGVEAALAAGMHVIGIGKREMLKEADIVLSGTELLAETDYGSLLRDLE